MRELSLHETQLTCGANASGTFGMLGGLVGTYYGATIGGTIAMPFALVGLVFALTPGNGILWSGVALSAGILGAGVVIGALMGASFGAGIGVLGGMATDTIINPTKS